MAGILLGALLLFVVCALGVPRTTIMAYAIESHDSAADTRAPSIFPYLGYDVPPSAGAYPIDASEELEDPSALLSSKETPDVGVNSFLSIEVHAHHGDGSPAQAAKVTFEWTSARGTETYTDYTNASGNASMTRWIGTDLRGETMIMEVTVDAGSWRNGDYTWFVPR